jgi:hypothetical protein
LRRGSTVDGTAVAKGRIEKTVPIEVSLDEGLDVREDTGTPAEREHPGHHDQTIENDPKSQAP